MNIHITQVITELEPAGAERVLADLSIELTKKNYSVSVVSLQSKPKIQTIVNELKASGIEIYFLNMTKKTPWRVFKLLSYLRELKRNYPSKNLLVHSHLMHANLACRFVKMLWNNFFLVNTIHIAERRQGIQNLFFLLDKWTIKYCDSYTAVSIAATSWHAKRLKISPDPIQVIYNGIRPIKNLTIEGKKNLIKEWNLESCSKIIGSVGRLDYQKGYDIFFKILPELSLHIPDNEIWGIVILGEGSQRIELENLIKDIPKNIKVLLPGYRNDAAECIGAFDLFVMPSRYEGFSLVLIEAVASNVPLLISNEADEMEETVKHAKVWQKTDFSDISKSIEKIFQLLRNDSEYNNDFHLTIHDMTDKYLEVYKQSSIARHKRHS